MANKPRLIVPYRVRRIVSRILLYLVLLFGAYIAVLPFIYMIANALKTYSETVTRVGANPFNPVFWPKKPQWGNFIQVIRDEQMGKYFLNSIIISSTTVLGILVTSSMAAYGFSKMHFRGKNIFFTLILATLMIPETVLLIPNFLIVSSLGWVDKLPALTVPFMASAFYIFLLRQFFNQIPDSIIESARIDGGSHFRIYAYIGIPLIKAPIFTAAFLAFMGAWNALQWPLVVTSSDRWRPITVGLTKYITEAGPETQLRMAGALVALTPAIIIYIIAQKQITESIANTGLKG